MQVKSISEYSKGTYREHVGRLIFQWQGRDLNGACTKVEKEGHYARTPLCVVQVINLELNLSDIRSLANFCFDY